MRKVKGMTLEERQEYNARIIRESEGPSAEDMIAYIKHYAAQKNGDTEMIKQYQDGAQRCMRAEELRVSRNDRLVLTPAERFKWNKLQRQRRKEEEQIFENTDGLCANNI